jgi:hypothetical protein
MGYAAATSISYSPLVGKACVMLNPLSGGIALNVLLTTGPCGPTRVPKVLEGHEMFPDPGIIQELPLG